METFKYFFCAALEDGTFITGLSPIEIKGNTIKGEIVSQSEIEKDKEKKENNIFKLKKRNKNQEA